MLISLTLKWNIIRFIVLMSKTWELASIIYSWACACLQEITNCMEVTGSWEEERTTGPCPMLMCAQKSRTLSRFGRTGRKRQIEFPTWRANQWRVKKSLVKMEKEENQSKEGLWTSSAASVTGGNPEGLLKILIFPFFWWVCLLTSFLETTHWFGRSSSICTSQRILMMLSCATLHMYHSKDERMLYPTSRPCNFSTFLRVLLPLSQFNLRTIWFVVLMDFQKLQRVLSLSQFTLPQSTVMNSLKTITTSLKWRTIQGIASVQMP